MHDPFDHDDIGVVAVENAMAAMEQAAGRWRDLRYQPPYLGIGFQLVERLVNPRT
jgi:hypothetical protein